MGSILSTFGSLAIGGIVASATIVGVVSSQTSSSGESPANVNQPVIQYGTEG
ncbi:MULTISPECIES: hypothetical protein [Nocardioides]|uniref:DUF2613 family protein n=1 Tax=Nocardioides deserti TaxID=1588644 RepID=A0ABR6U362_9ACTN|nr:MULTISPECIES: hypothetical protein [Nocardioides]MBC2958842.1 hypothetical protein [Nocardioides deserti]NHC23007.1 hypothetical protein [Nocardioides sp. IC4_145]GGO69493.1 hypothetical protein GCM10012276_05810 [Nocardioides deserti]